MAGAPAPQSPGQQPAEPPVQPSGKPHATLEKWIWVLIYGGLFLVIVGLVAGRSDAALGWSIAAPGALVALAGVVLIYVRSRLD